MRAALSWRPRTLGVLTASAMLAGLAFQSAPKPAIADHAPVASPIPVSVGVGTGTTTGNVYLPPVVTIHTGDAVKFTIASDEPHTVTFGQPAAGTVPPGTPPDAWPNTFGIPEGPPQPHTVGPVDYNGTGFVNTGVVFKGSSATIRFTQAGSYAYVCVIHPGMNGAVNVVASGQQATSAADATGQAAQQSQTVLAQVGGLRQSTLQGNTTTARADGTRLITVAVNGLSSPMDLNSDTIPDGYLELMEFIPKDITIQKGDTIRWQATAPHTVTFLPPGADPQQYDPFQTPASKPSEAYDGTSFYNSGFLSFAPDAPKSFELTFNQTGTFPYLCLLHSFLGQTGTVTVQASAQTTAPGAAPGPASTGTGDSIPAAPLFGAVAGIALLSLAGAAGFARMRRDPDNG